MVNTRVGFAVFNLPIEQVLRCGEIRLEPVTEIAQVLERLQHPDPQSEVTAEGTWPLGMLNPDENVWAKVGRSLVALELLLSFAHRCHIRVGRVRSEGEVDGEWRRHSIPSRTVRDGKAHATPWCLGHRELEGFLSRAHPKFLTPTLAEDQGLRLALAFLAETYTHDVEELNYLKTWIAFEVLYSRGVKAQILTGGQEKRVKHTIREYLQAEVAAERLRPEQMAAVEEKLPELRRLSTAAQAAQFCDRVFRNYEPVQKATADELHALSTVRNDLAHTGAAKVERLPEKLRQLTSLVERVILAMLDERPHLMEVPWPKCYAAR